MTRNGSTYSFLDLAVLPEVGAAVLDSRPAWLWRADGTRILWANAAGAEWFEAPSATQLIGRSFSRRSLAVREIARLAATLPVDEPRLTVLSLPRGVTEQAQSCICRIVALPDGARALLVTAADDETGRVRLAAAARRLLPAVADTGAAVAIFDGEGGLLVHSRDYPILDPFAPEIDAFVESFLAGDDASQSRAIGGGDAARPARLARIRSAVGDLLVLSVGVVRPMVETMEDLENWRAAPRPPRDDVITEDPVALLADALPEATPVLPSGGADDDAAAVAGSTPADDGTADAEHPSAPEPPSSLHPAVVRQVPAAPSEAPARADAPPSQATAGPVRFAWEMDADQRFTFVSPEFAEAVGSGAAAIVGQSWSDLAAERQLDAEGTVAHALSRHDSWSGLTVAWPTDRGGRVPVDLAALPAFSRDRTFAGYRGFGVCRCDDVIAAEPVAELAADVFAAATDTGGDSETAPAAAPNPASNIVRLRGTRADPAIRSEVLSGYERDAFRRIAEELGVPVAGEVANARSDTTPEDAASKAAPVAGGFDPRLLDRLPIGIVVFREKAILFVNRAALELLGYDTPDAFVAGGGVEAVFPGSDSEWTGEPGEKLRARRRDRSEIEVEARLNTAPWGDGLALVLSLYRPVRAPAAEAGETTEAVEADKPSAPVFGDDRIAELEAILDTATDGVILIDGLGLILSLNRSAQALFGIDPGAAIGKPFVELLAEESRKSALDYLDGLTRNGVASLLNDGREVIGRVPSGGLIPLFMTIGRLSESGKYCAVLRDITQWKNAEEELVNARRQAEIANSQKSEFLAKISHEIRTPLNAVIGFSEVMMEERFGPIGSDRYREYLRDIHLSGAHLLSLINDLLDLSKIEAGKLELKFEQVAVNTVIQECVALMQPEANRERIIIRTSLSAGLPDIVVDRRSLRQIVLNLLSNAIKFTQPGGQVIVSTSLEETGEVTIRIRDTGIGMSEKQIETAMTPFRQVERAGQVAPPGTGLGLPLTKALVEANRASFAIESAVDQGTLVRITFPVTRVLAG